MKCLTSAEEEVKDPLPMIDASDERGGSIDSSDIIDWMRSPHPSNCTRIEWSIGRSECQYKCIPQPTTRHLATACSQTVSVKL
mmetsp:Transcript_42838/g.71345  ORF Transcript_42838/g.71345 Transcript_42838/m.71345 type:complete len:83 (+) Transcript_42838:14-262(+)